MVWLHSQRRKNVKSASALLDASMKCMASEHWGTKSTLKSIPQVQSLEDICWTQRAGRQSFPRCFASVQGLQRPEDTNTLCEQCGWGNLSLHGFWIPYWLYRGNMLGFCSSQPLLAQFTGVSKHQQKAMVKLHKMVKVWKRHLKVSHSAVYLFLCSRLWLWLLIWGSASNQLRLHNVHFAICNVTL